ncbi:MAG: hypothetical protein WEC59_05920 [Salibacteraceae bacterium]
MKKSARAVISSYLIMILLALMACEPTEERVVSEQWNEKQPKLVKYYLEKEEQKVKVREERFYKDGIRQYEGSFDETGDRHGEWRYYYTNGNLWSLGEYEHGLKHGKKEVYWPDGNKRYIGKFTNDEKSGNWIFFDTDGTVLQERNFSIKNE